MTLDVRSQHTRGTASAPRRRSRRLLVTIHIATSVALFGTSVELVLSASRAASAETAREANDIYELIRVLTYAIGIPFSFVALASGILLAVTSRWGVFRHWWVTGKLALLVGTLAVGGVLDGPTIDSLRHATTTGHMGAASQRWTLIAAFAAQAAMVFAALTLAVYKPRGRLPHRRPR
jgi:hypothetical protein